MRKEQAAETVQALTLRLSETVDQKETGNDKQVDQKQPGPQQQRERADAHKECRGKEHRLRARKEIRADDSHSSGNCEANEWLTRNAHVQSFHEI